MGGRQQHPVFSPNASLEQGTSSVHVASAQRGLEHAVRLWRADTITGITSFLLLLLLSRVVQQAPNNKLLNLKGSQSEKSFPGLHPGRKTDCFKTRELQAWNPRLVSPNKALARWCPGDISALLKAEERPCASWALSMASWAAPDRKLSSSVFRVSPILCALPSDILKV